MRALILCAGRGSRLYPLTHLLPKGLVPIAGKPLLVHNLERLAQAGIREIGLIVGQNKDDFYRILGDGRSYGVELTYLVQEQPLGLAHAVRVGRDYVQKFPHFLVLLGDNLFSSNFRDFIDRYLSSEAESQVMLVKVEKPSNFGVANVSGNKITKLVEKPQNPESSWAVAGLYAFTTDIFQHIENIEPSARGELELTDAIDSQIRNGCNVRGYFTADYWYDIGNFSSLLQANSQYLVQLPAKVEGELAADCLFSGNVIVGKGCKLTDTCLTGPVLIQEESRLDSCRIGPNVMLGKRVRLKNCAVKNSIILDESNLSGVEGVITDSVIGPNSIVRRNEEKEAERTLILGADSKIII